MNIHPKSGHTSRHLNAFTLVELLAVIAVIGLLVLITLPAIQSMREKAAQTKCANNLRNIGAGIQLYANDNNMNLPWGYDPNYGYWSAILNRGDYLPYGRMEENIFACPTPDNKPEWDPGSSRIRSNYSSNFIAMKEKKDDTTVPIKMNQVMRPSEVVLVMDAAVNADGNSGWGVYSHPGLTAPGSGSPNAAETSVPRGPDDDGSSSAVINWRHDNHANFLFVDGHVEAMDPREVRIKNFHTKY